MIKIARVQYQISRSYIMRIAICDDDKQLRKDLRHLIEVQLDLMAFTYEIEEYESGNALLEHIDKKEPDILFLDIEMPGMGGMDTAKALRKLEKKMLIIFITAYPDYVFQGYEVHAFHYILKPYDKTKLKEVLEGAVRELDSQEELFYTIQQKSGTLRLSLQEISYFKSDKRNVCAVQKNGEQISFYEKLDNVESELPDFFQRIHNRYLVNMNCISKLESASCICGGEELPVSRTYKQPLAVAFARTMLN